MGDAFSVDESATFDGLGWRAVPLGEQHAESLGRLFEECPDYFELIQGAPPREAEVQSAFTSLPEGKAYEDKFAFVLLDETDDLFGHFELIRDYPTSGQWWIGILLLRPDKRGRGLGAEVEKSAGEWVRVQGGAGLQLSVVEKNRGALGFWTRLGYKEKERRDPRRIGEKEHSLVVLYRPL